MRLQVIHGDVEMLGAAVDDPPALGKRLNAELAAGLIDDEWRGAFNYSRDELQRKPELFGWWTCIFLLERPRTVCGMGGFKGPPDVDGTVELGYSIAPAFRGQGLATQAAREMLRMAFADLRITAVFAHTLAERNASTRVLEKCGFTKVAEMIVPSEGIFPVWRWRIARP
jgi:RimJ/RimL family protein N-acetyltransferase